MPILIETERMILRQFIASDYPAVYAFNSNKEVQKYTGDRLLQSEEEAKNLIVNISEPEYRKYGYGRWAAVYKANNQVIGFAGLKYLPELGETDIGFRFLPAYWGQGIATEVSKEIIAYGFEKLDLKRIIGIAMPENIGSCRVLEKIGLQFYKIADYDGDGGNYRWYEIDKERYFKPKD